jgi:gas vesicle protein
MSNLFKGAMLFAGGAAVGAAAALLLTTKAGEEIRSQIADLAQDLKKCAQDYCEQVKQDLAQAEVKAEEAQVTEQKSEA